jgi:putative hydrolase of the HAD superfamily
VTEAVIFDLWQTLAVWPAEASAELYRRMSETLAIDHDRFVTAWRDNYPQREFGPIRDALGELCTDLELAHDGRLERLLEMRLDHHRRHLVPRADAVETVRALKERGLRVGLITVCSQEVELLWEETPLAPYFDATVFSSAEGFGKPDPRIYRIAAERLGLQPDACVFVGDGANHELPGAERVGMRAIQLRVPGEPLTAEGEEWRGDYVESLSEVPARV